VEVEWKECNAMQCNGVQLERLLARGSDKDKWWLGGCAFCWNERRF
jgi:hypothetical protein